MSTGVNSRIVQITNISPSCQLEQIRMLFGSIGVIEELVLYPPEGNDCPSKVCYVNYADKINAEVALHLHNTMFLDRALIVLPVVDGKDAIPDEKYANLVRAPLHTSAGIHPRSANWPLDVINMVVGRPGEQVIQTIEPRLTTLGFPVYPPLPAATDCNRIEEIRRTVLVTNLDPTTTGDQVLEFFNAHAEVKCVRMAGTDGERAAYVEFTEQPSLIKAFGLMGGLLGDRQIMVQHSNCSIIKPTSTLPGLDDIVKKASPPHNPAVSTSVSQGKHRSPIRARVSRSRSKSRRRRGGHVRSRSRRRASRSKSRDKRRPGRANSRSHARRISRRSRSLSVRRDRSRRRSRSRDRRRRSRERRDRDLKRDSRIRDRDRVNRSRDHDRHDRKSRGEKRSRSPEKRSREKDRATKRTSEDRKDKRKIQKKEKSSSPENLAPENGYMTVQLGGADIPMPPEPTPPEIQAVEISAPRSNGVGKKPVGVTLARPEDDMDVGPDASSTQEENTNGKPVETASSVSPSD